MGWLGVSKGQRRRTRLGKFAAIGKKKAYEMHIIHAICVKRANILVGAVSEELLTEIHRLQAVV